MPRPVNYSAGRANAPWGSLPPDCKILKPYLSSIIQRKDGMASTCEWASCVAIEVREASTSLRASFNQARWQVCLACQTITKEVTEHDLAVVVASCMAFLHSDTWEDSLTTSKYTPLVYTAAQQTLTFLSLEKFSQVSHSVGETVQKVPHIPGTVPCLVEYPGKKSKCSEGLMAAPPRLCR
jgi:hypothetical protein